MTSIWSKWKSNHIEFKFHSQFSDIYQEEHFINYLNPDIRIVKELPEELKSLDLEAIGSVVSSSSKSSSECLQLLF